ncbi:hypothetical protein FALBO_7164 [Fusarium albosuccineum]|uniref:SH3 domain-containing protein n=1 Tax=Fusarium albosuccineum TaxID=1237068 RepID=A0A8H4LBS7_9HYPO|nr:hypothetical protein FALBO_7164 [Fusarium albosuccineum]
MSDPADHVLLRPFNDVTKWAKCALLQANGSLSDDYQQIPLNRSSQALLREGERALRRLTPLLDKPSPQLSDFLRDLTLRNNDVVSQVRSIDILLYDFEDFIEPQTFDKAKFDELQAATKELAITLVERITRFTTKSALELPSPPSQFPPLPPLPPLPDVPRPGSQLSSRPSTSVSTSGPGFGRSQRRPSLTRASEQRDGFRAPPRPARPVGYFASPSPISPSSLASPGSLPFSNQSTIPEQEKAAYDYVQTHQRQMSTSEVIANGLQGLGIRAMTPPSSVALSPRSTTYQSPINPSARGSSGYSYQDTPPPSVAAELASEQDWSPATDHQPAAVPRNLGSIPPHLDGRTTSFRDYQDSKQYPYTVEASTEHHRSSIVTQGSGPSIRSDASGGSGVRAASISSGATHKTDSVSMRGLQSPRITPCDIGPDSSISMLGGFCKGARAFAAGGPGQAIRKVGGASDSTTRAGDQYSPDMLFGSMLATSTEAYAEPTAQCISCEYKSPYSHLFQDMDQDPLASQQARGVVYRSRFLYKSHIAVRNVNSIYFGCLFCDKAKSTISEGDATVFQTVDLLLRHISRHPRPLPHIPGVVVAYENAEINSRGRQDYDLYFPNSAPPAPYVGFPASEADRIACLPVARATKDHIRRRNEKPQARPDSVSEVLQFMAGARIVGVEFPEKWDGKWCQGWHDGAFGTFPSKIIDLELPQHVNPASLPRSPRTGVARWKFGAKSRRAGWLAFGKGDTIYNLAWEDPHAWFWSGSDAKGEHGIFPKSHISIESVQDGSLGDTRQRHVSKEKSRFGGLFGKSR